MLVFLMIAMVVLTVVSREIRIGVTAGADVLAGEGFLRACVFRIPVIKTAFRFDLSSKTVAPAPVTAATEMAAEVVKKQKYPLKSVAVILTNLRVRCVETEVHIGSVRDPLFTTLAFGSVRVLLQSALTLLKTRYPSASVSAPLVPEYRKDCCYMSGSAVVYISILDIAYGFLKLMASKMRTRRKNKTRPATAIGAKRSIA